MVPLNFLFSHSISFFLHSKWKYIKFYDFLFIVISFSFSISLARHFTRILRWKLYRGFGLKLKSVTLYSWQEWHSFATYPQMSSPGSRINQFHNISIISLVCYQIIGYKIRVCWSFAAALAFWHGVYRRYCFWVNIWMLQLVEAVSSHPVTSLCHSFAPPAINNLCNFITGGCTRSQLLFIRFLFVLTLVVGRENAREMEKGDILLGHMCSLWHLGFHCLLNTNTVFNLNLYPLLYFYWQWVIILRNI